MVRYFYKFNAPCLNGANLLKVYRNARNPFFPGSFASVAMYELQDGEIIGIVF